MENEGEFGIVCTDRGNQKVSGNLERYEPQCIGGAANLPELLAGNSERKSGKKSRVRRLR